MNYMGFWGPSVLMSSEMHFLSKYFVVNLPLKILEIVVLWGEKTEKKDYLTAFAFINYAHKHIRICMDVGAHTQTQEKQAGRQTERQTDRCAHQIVKNFACGVLPAPVLAVPVSLPVLSPSCPVPPSPGPSAASLKDIWTGLVSTLSP